MAVLEQRGNAAIAGIILAAGTSSRMGRTKQLLSVDGEPLLQITVDAVAASDVVEVIVVLGHDADRVRDAIRMPANTPLRFLVCEDYASGQSASLATGLAGVADNIDAAAILLGDQPEVDVFAVDRVLKAWRGAFEPVVRPLFRAEDGQSIPGHPVVCDRSVFAALAAETGDQGARSWMREHPEFVCNVEIEATAPDDVDTWEDFLRIAGRRATKGRQR